MKNTKILRLIVREASTPPALYQRIIAGRNDKTTSSDIRALAMIAVIQNLDVEPLHEQYVGDTRLTLEFSLGSASALTRKLERVMAETGLSRPRALLKLMTAGWFHKTNPQTASKSKPIVVDVAAPVRQQGRNEVPKNTSEPLHVVAQPKTLEPLTNQAHIELSNRMIDAVMDAFG